MSTMPHNERPGGHFFWPSMYTILKGHVHNFESKNLTTDMKT